MSKASNISEAYRLTEELNNYIKTVADYDKITVYIRQLGSDLKLMFSYVKESVLKVVNPLIKYIGYLLECSNSYVIDKNI
ncbi:MAG: hypothetical protein LBE34_12525 [Flavobacteriaceae bacterium]|jgi:hypothetical protein|nr:hypothetical protein [Flavobacteriaceae bacterium]